MEEEELNVPDRIREQIKFNTEKLKLLVIGLISVGGGTTALLTRVHSEAARYF